jgi:quercetin dioxygenase-like cupin family protein
MSKSEIEIHRWVEDQAPTEIKLRHLLRGEGLEAHRWSNGPGDRYGAHTHPYDKVIYVVRGSITFGLPNEDVTLSAGDRLELPRDTRHQAVVGPQGVVCLEAHRA